MRFISITILGFLQDLLNGIINYSQRLKSFVLSSTKEIFIKNTLLFTKGFEEYLNILLI